MLPEKHRDIVHDVVNKICKTTSVCIAAIGTFILTHG